jgi:hypothetical protein
MSAWHALQALQPRCSLMTAMTDLSCQRIHSTAPSLRIFRQRRMHVCGHETLACRAGRGQAMHRGPQQSTISSTRSASSSPRTEGGIPVLKYTCAVCRHIHEFKGQLGSLNTFRFSLLPHRGLLIMTYVSGIVCVCHSARTKLPCMHYAVVQICKDVRVPSIKPLALRRHMAG